MSAVDPGKPNEKLAMGNARSDIVQRASIAQLLLVARLRARNRRDLGVDLLERATHVILVTCRNWFSSGLNKSGPGEKEVNNVPGKNTESKNAHRNH